MIIAATVTGLLLGIIVALANHCYKQHRIIKSLRKPFLVLTPRGSEIVRDDAGNIVHIYTVGRN